MLFGLYGYLALFIKVEFRTFISSKKILLKFQNFENQIDLLKAFGCPKVY
jgi:hypothetical protein